MFVNVPGTLPGMAATRPYELISALPGVVAHAAYIGLSGVPLAHGKPDNSFLVNSLNGSLDGEYFSQDRATVLAGLLPPQGSTSTVVLTPAIAKAFGTGVGGVVSYRFQPVDAQQQPAGQRFTRSFRVAAIVTVPPALVDESDQEEGSIFPPGATRQLLPEYFYAWIGLRLAQGAAGIADLQQNLATLSQDLQRQVRQAVHRDVPPPSFTVNRTDVIRNKVQQAIRPEAVALSLFGAIAALAMLVLVGQGLAQVISRAAPDTAVLRALGATRGQAALAAALPGVIAVLGGMALAVAAAVAVSPLAPVGPVRRYDPDHGINADGLVLGAGAAILGLVLLGLLAVLAVRSVRPRDSGAGVGSSAVARAAAAAGLPAAGGRAVAGADRAQPGPPAPPRARPAQGARHDARAGQGRHRLADHADAADRGRSRRGAGHRRGPTGLARLRRIPRDRADRRSTRSRPDPRPGRAGAGRQPAGVAARGRGRADAGRGQPADRVTQAAVGHQTLAPGLALRRIRR